MSLELEIQLQKCDVSGRHRHQSSCTFTELHKLIKFYLSISKPVKWKFSAGSLCENIVNYLSGVLTEKKVKNPCSRNSTYGLGAKLLDAAVEDSASSGCHRHILCVYVDKQRPLTASHISLQYTSGNVTWRRLFHRQTCRICRRKQQRKQQRVWCEIHMKFIGVLIAT